jgi:hypothetical protein
MVRMESTTPQSNAAQPMFRPAPGKSTLPMVSRSGTSALAHTPSTPGRGPAPVGHSAHSPLAQSLPEGSTWPPVPSPRDPVATPPPGAVVSAHGGTWLRPAPAPVAAPADVAIPRSRGPLVAVVALVAIVLLAAVAAVGWMLARRR